ncbi:MAG: DNA repair protein RadC [Proteobacteria bacterium]|nr:DNA repair protein RadC [Pseudomonadota bacterium]
MGSKSSHSRPKGGTTRPTLDSGLSDAGVASVARYGAEPVAAPGAKPDVKPDAKSGAKFGTHPHHLEHRHRLRRRFLTAGTDALADYEMLELVLFAPIPRRDVKPLAKELIQKFGSFADVIAAPAERLKEVNGVGEAIVAALKTVDAAAIRLARGRMLNRPVLSSWEALLDYCTATMARAQTEEIRIIFLDRKNIILADEVHQQGTVDHTPVYPREVVKRALELGASALILVHNHPSGDPTPSRADIAMTREIALAAKALKIELHDHLVIGKGGYASFKALGLL